MELGLPLLQGPWDAWRGPVLGRGLLKMPRRAARRSPLLREAHWRLRGLLKMPRRANRRSSLLREAH